MANEKVLALAGGVGGAKLALGLTGVLAARDLTIVVNTADDFEHWGLYICPDLDTVMYTLAGLANPETGWGRKDETWNVLAAIGAVGGETWFRLGDKDLATHVVRGPACRVSTHSGTPSPPFQSASGTRVQWMPSPLVRARGRDFETGITRCSLRSTSASARRRNAYHGLGLIGSFSGVQRIRKSCGPIRVHSFTRAPSKRLSTWTAGTPASG